MSFVIRHDTPLMQGALAAGVGTELGRALVQRAVHLREQENLRTFQTQALRRPAEAGPGGGRPMRVGLTPRGSEPVRPAAYSPFRDGPRPITSTTLAEPGTPANPFIQRRPVSQPAPESVEEPGYRERQGQERLVQGWERLRQQEQVAAARQADEDERQRIQRERIAATSERRQPTSRSDAEESGSILAGTLDPASLAGMLAPARTPAPIDTDTGQPVADPITGEPASWKDSDRRAAANLARAIPDLPFEKARDGTYLYSLRQLQDRLDGLAKAKVPPGLLAALQRGVEARGQEAAQAAALARTSVSKALADPTARGQATPDLVAATKAQALAEAGAAFGMSAEQMVDALAWLSSRGVKLPVPERPQRLVERDVPGRPGVREVVPTR